MRELVENRKERKRKTTLLDGEKGMSETRGGGDRVAGEEMEKNRSSGLAHASSICGKDIDWWLAPDPKESGQDLAGIGRKLHYRPGRISVIIETSAGKEISRPIFVEVLEQRRFRYTRGRRKMAGLRPQQFLYLHQLVEAVGRQADTQK